MSNISDAFKNGKAFIGFVTAGDPDLDTSLEIMTSMAQGGCDLIEIGIPFSDPIAEGPVIQEADLRSLENGTTTDKVFDLTKKLREKVDIPLVYMTYLNVLFKYGYDRFLQNAKESGVSGVIVPDLPFEEKNELQSVADKYDIDVISLVAPTSEDRGMRSEITTDLGSIVSHIKSVTDTPVAIGFGINTPEQAKKYSAFADGVIVGSAIVNLVAEHGKESPKFVYDYVKAMKEAIS